jgi:LMBR1 domain-containing protein 1
MFSYLKLKNNKNYFIFFRPNETWMNSFLFNIAIILICSVSLTHFITMAFDQYCRLAESNFIFNVLIKNLKFY